MKTSVLLMGVGQRSFFKLMKKWLKADEILIYFVSLQHTNGLRSEPRT